MSTTGIGRWAEDLASEYLEGRGFKIIGRNWKTRWCEIDIIAKKADTIHFVEVKYRGSPEFGSGLDYITKAKARQLKYAALFWIGERQWTGDYQIDVISVDGGTRPKISFISNAISG